MELRLLYRSIVIEITDILIIYAACGAPFSIQYLTLETTDVGTRRIFKATLAGVIWPATLIAAIVGALKQPIAAADELSAEVAALCDEYEFSLKLSPRLARVFRDDADRYVELTSNASLPAELDLIRAVELFKLAGNPRNDIAAACYERKTRRILRSNADRAAVAFRRTVDEIAQDQDTANGIIARFESLARSTTGDAGTLSDDNDNNRSNDLIIAME